MLEAILRRKKLVELEVVDRNFDPPYLLSPEHHAFYCKYGYTVIRNCIPNWFIDDMLALYASVQKLEGLPQSGRFYSSGNLVSPKVRSLCQETIKARTKDVLRLIANPENCELETGGALQIKPPSDHSDLGPHQDNPLIDEQDQYATYVWVPIQDVSRQNGTLCILPGSHLWGNHQRARSIPWIFGKHEKLILKNMIPLDLKRGDAVCFDSATIHSSTANLSDKVRLGVSMAIFPSGHEMVHHYHRDSSTPKGKVEKYLVDEDFYIRQDVMKRPGPQYEMTGLENWFGNNYFKKDSVRRIIEAFRPDDIYNSDVQ